MFDTHFYDYVINTDTKLITNGYKNIKVHNVYDMVFAYNKLVSGNKLKCPKCGAELANNNTGTCPYCRAKISTNNSKASLVKKSRIN